MAIYAAERRRVRGRGRRAAGAHREPPLAVGDRRLGQRASSAPSSATEPDRTIGPPYVPIVAERDARARRARRRVDGRSRATCARGTSAAPRRSTSRPPAAPCSDQGWQVQERDGDGRGRRACATSPCSSRAHRPERLERALRDGRHPLPRRGRQPGLPHPGAARPHQLPHRHRRPHRRGRRGRRAAQPAYACSDVELAEHRRGGVRFNYLAPALDGADRPVVAGAALTLRGAPPASATTARWPPSSSASSRSGMLVEVGLVDAASRDAFRRARFVVEQARAFEADAAPEPARLRRVAGGAHGRADPRPRRRRPGRRRGRRPHPDHPRRQGPRVPHRDPRGHRAEPAYARPPTVSLDAGGEVVAVVGHQGRAVRRGRRRRRDGARGAPPAAEAARAALRGRHPRPRPPGRVAVPLRQVRDQGRRPPPDRRRARPSTAVEWVPPRALGRGRRRAVLRPRRRARGDRLPRTHRAARAALWSRGRAGVRYTSATGIAAATARPRPRAGRADRRRAVGARPRRHPRGARRARVAAEPAAGRGRRRDRGGRARAGGGRGGPGAGRRGRAPGARGRWPRRPRPGRGWRSGALREVPFALARDGAVVEGFIDLVIPIADGARDRRLEDRRRGHARAGPGAAARLRAPGGPLRPRPARGDRPHRGAHHLRLPAPGRRAVARGPGCARRGGAGRPGGPG